MDSSKHAVLDRDIRKLVMALGFCATCVLLNVLGSQLASLTSAPLFLDCVGTIVAAIVGGPISGILAGYLTNILNTLFDPTSIYYGVISVLIAVVAFVFWHRGWLRRPLGVLGAILSFALIGGGISSIITWWLFGFGFTGGVSTPLAQTLYTSVIPFPMGAQVAADFVIDLMDKSIVTVVALVVVRLIPASWRASFELTLWLQTPLTEEDRTRMDEAQPRVLSLRSKVFIVVLAMMVVMGVTTTAISYAMFNGSMIKEQEGNGSGIARLVCKAVQANRVGDYVDLGQAAEGYEQTEQALERTRMSVPSIQRISVYQVRDDGCHVVFDLSEPEEQNVAPGTVLPFTGVLLDKREAMLVGMPVESAIQNNGYDRCLTVWQPLYDASGASVAYAEVTIGLGRVVDSGYVFLVRIISLFAAFFIVVCVVAMWLANYSIVLPLNSIALASSSFAYDNKKQRANTVAQVHQLNIHTGDEVENLYEAVDRTAGDIVRYIVDTQQKTQTIERMQANLIMVMADLVESRDQFTGEHVRKTAAYVRATMDEMRREGVYANQMTDEFMSDVEHSAPLHDIGKIVVSDTILNKPGRLTEDEFKAMQVHTLAGAQIIERAVGALSDPSYLDEAKRLAVAHHEKWDGSGYPNGLSGEDIPLSARIMAVADVFDALVSKRSYKDGFPIERALDIIREGMGTHFDPLVAQAFLNAEEKVRAIAEGYGDDGGTQLFDAHEG